MVTHGKFALYRMPSSPIMDGEDVLDSIEDNITDKVEFEGDAEVPDARSKIISFDPVLGRHNAENPLPHANRADKPDTGFAGDTYTVNVLFDETTDTADAIARIKTWMSQDQTVDGLYEEGSIGLRNDYRPEFDLLPNNNAGYKIVRFEIHQNLAVNHLVPGVIVLEFSGDPARLGA